MTKQKHSSSSSLWCRAKSTFAGLGLLAMTAHPAFAAAPAPIDCVSPLVGTDAHGHTYPGATVPFGLVQLSPDTPLQGWDGSSGYHYSDSAILGFSHTHLSGTGVGGLGDILLMPTVGDVHLDSGTPGNGYMSRFSHTQETATPGYYKVFLQDPKVTAELTATARCGFHMYTFPQTDAAHIVLDLAHGVGNDPFETTLHIDNATTLSGSRISDGWGGRREVFFVMQFSRPFDSSGIEQNGQRLADGTQSAEGKSVKAFFSYKTTEGEAIEVKVALSGTGVEGARRNLATEVPGWDFAAVHAAAARQWSTALDAVKIDTFDPHIRRTFYTNLYQSELAPVLYNDDDGTYKGVDHQNHPGNGFQNYTTFSLWDIFRAESPLLTIVQPSRVPDMTHSLLMEYQQAGKGQMPIWPLWDNETYCMIGYHSAPVIADAYLKGLMPADGEATYQALRSTAMQDSDGPGHDGLDQYRQSGYVYSSSGGQKQSVSRTLEYAYDDWCIAQMAQRLGHAADAKLFLNRAADYRNVFDTTTGFMRGRKADGSWRGPFNPKQLVWADYTEANAWQYTWSVMQDLPGLVNIMGGDAPFIARLDGLFDAKSDVISNIPDITGLIGQYAHGNEPVHHVAYLYNYAGAPYKTQARVRQIMKNLYDDTPAGQCGNVDCGQMSAWYVFSALGFYPVNPVGGVYVLGSPLVSKATIQLDKAHYGGHTFTIIAHNNSAVNMYIQSASLNGKPLTRSWFTQSQLAAGGVLSLSMGPKPNMLWGKAIASRPPSGMPVGMKYAALPTPSAPVKIIALSLPIHIICGSDDPAGGFVPDPNMMDGSVSAANPVIDTSVPNAAPAAVYQSERYGSDFTYAIPVPKGHAYTVRLHFAEIFDNGTGERVENIAINDQPALSNFDIFTAAGGVNKAVVREFNGVTPDAKGMIRIHITAVKDSPDQNAKISGIEILEPSHSAAR
ncbi:MAG: GH92 family glycosyl hydrolase [Janthinobacterium lividum]